MAKIQFIVTKISEDKKVHGAKLFDIDANELSELEQHDLAWKKAIELYPEFFPEDHTKTTVTKGNGLFSESLTKGIGRNNIQFFTTLYVWQGRYKF